MNSVLQESKNSRKSFLLVGVLLGGLILASLIKFPDSMQGIANYLPLHNLLETLSIIFSTLIFAIIWNLRNESLPGSMLLLGAGFLGVALLDFSHMLSYDGMPAFVTPSSPEKAIWFWLAARLLSGVTLFLATLFSSKRILPFCKSMGSCVLAILTLVTLLHLLFLFWPEILPRTFIPGQGLTPLKLTLEGLAIALHLVTAVLALKKHKAKEYFHTRNLFVAATIMAQSGIFFMMYGQVTDIYNILGHIYKIIADLLLYRAVFVETIRTPYRKLKLSEQELQLTLDTLPDLLIEMDEKGTYLNVHTGQHNDLSEPINKLIGKTVNDALTKQSAAVVLAALQTAKEKEVVRGTIIPVNISNQDRWFELSIMRKPALHDAQQRFTVISRDITENRRILERIRKLSNYDQLTGLPFPSLLKKHFEYACKPKQPAALLWIGLDHFKNINDALSHHYGDLVLQEVAYRFRTRLSSFDILTRFSGDNFVIFSPDANQDKATQLAQTLKQTLATPIRLGNESTAVTASIGITLYPADGQDIDTLLKNAETAMYAAKNAGRDGFRYFKQEMQEQSVRALTLSNALKLALERNELYLEYQPLIDSYSNKLVGAEALLRWKNAQLGQVSPAEFIPVAEATGLILPIGEWVLRTALNQLTHWFGPKLPEFTMAVNVSALQFQQVNFIAQLDQLLKETGIPARHLELELTEAIALYSPFIASQQMAELRNLGIRLSIDDFGTGYSSMTYLKQFKVNTIKIDQSFVRNLEASQEDQAIIQAIIQLASGLGMSTVAEGVETKAQQQFLIAKGCDIMQGYLYSKPLPHALFKKHLLESSIIR